MILNTPLICSAFLCTLLTFTTPAKAIALAPAVPIRPNPIRPNPVRPDPVRPGPVRPGPNHVPNAKKPPPKLPKLPEPEGWIVDDDAASIFSLGSFKPNEQALFENFDERTAPFFSKMYDFFAAKETYLDTRNDVYARATGDENPFQKGQPRPTGQPLHFSRTVKAPVEHVITSTFDPSKPTDVCHAWKSLATYCGSRGAECACYSGTYYVPDQWNSLAAGCAVLTTRCASSRRDPWCQIGQVASDYTAYCVTNKAELQDVSSVKFAAEANIRTPRAQPRPRATSI